MKIIAALGAVLCLSAASPALAGDAQGAARNFGLIGDWAGDCAQPPSPDNDYARFRPRQHGDVDLTYDLGEAGESQYRFDEAHILPGDNIMLHGVFFGNGLRQEVVFERRRGAIRVLQSRDSTGHKLVVDGVITANGRPSNWKARCR